VREKFLPDRLPAPESMADYDPAGNVQLGPEYADWFNSAENGLRDRAILASTNSELRITSPLLGSVYVLDPDVPSTRRIPLAVNGGTQMRWESESLICRSEPGADFALAAEGEHRIVVTDLASGRRAETWIRVRSL
jgi:penicillin-binding protein 1C